MYPKVKEIEVLVDNKKIDLPIAPVNNQYSSNEYAETVEIIFTLEINTVPKTQVTISYQIAGEGKMLVNMHYYGQKGLPELPALGLRFIMPTKAKFLSMKAYQGKHIRIGWLVVSKVFIKWQDSPFPHTLFPKNAACIWKRNG